ncbi:ExeM/NucH family extracellular endonuclease [Marinobacter panjinensis]|uniref:ExeM/NucH family extracellular endonuclease n=1 Tax=Marinobacter panjinensis TaxID=2576384 RepID=A0A4U6R7U1_9GAMM|nr:ExeM/NucH family extracellular endonuclease [Marinobacter panjinensis]MCR8914151.1 ExeM/NucH family extracellular endonuclease [Marinobacter panjinensis]TKV68992.1 ExeM/NucH family extracellular endonuclease [Marinobacter panjinensis]
MTTLRAPIQNLLATVLLLWLPVVASAEGCGAFATAISKVQGEDARSPLAGQTVTVEGVITMDARHKGGFRGFYLQQTDDETDGSPNTSEALFVYTGRSAGSRGQRVRVSGRVKEFHGLTELTDVDTFTVCGTGPLPAPVPVTLPWPDHQRPEHLENMLVTIAGELTVIDHYNLARYGELTLAAGDQTIPTEFMEPGPSAAALFQSQQGNRLLLDDARGVRDPRPVPWPTGELSADNTVRAGDRVNRLSGILDFRFDAWRVQPLSPPAFQSANPRPDPPTRPDTSTLRVVTLNLGNLFNGDGRGGGFPAPRGAKSRKQFDQQLAMLVTALRAPEPDIIAVTEVENDGYGSHSAIADLANALGEQWRYVKADSGTGSDAIRTDLLYRSDRVATEGEASRLTSAPFSRRGRPPVAQAFRHLGNDRVLRIIVPHLKSKACRGAKGPDRDQNDGQGCYSFSREQATRAILRWADSLPQPDNLAGTLITGDMNSYAREVPLQLITDAGYTNAVRQFHACNEAGCNKTSYRYHGRSGTLDYSLVSKGLAGRLVGATTWSINADEPPALGYKGPIPAAESQPWRSSDHDPVITDFSL